MPTPRIHSRPPSQPVWRKANGSASTPAPTVELIRAKTLWAAELRGSRSISSAAAGGTALCCAAAVGGSSGGGKPAPCCDAAGGGTPGGGGGITADVLLLSINFGTLPKRIGSVLRPESGRLCSDRFRFSPVLAPAAQPRCRVASPFCRDAPVFPIRQPTRRPARYCLPRSRLAPMAPSIASARQGGLAHPTARSSATKLPNLHGRRLCVSPPGHLDWVRRFDRVWAATRPGTALQAWGTEQPRCSAFGPTLAASNAAEAHRHAGAMSRARQPRTPPSRRRAGCRRGHALPRRDAATRTRSRQLPTT